MTSATFRRRILYRHFSSKRELYFARLDEVAADSDALEAKIEELGPAEAWRNMRASAMREMKTLLPSLWMQAITEAGEDPETRRFVRGHMREVHDFVVGCSDASRRAAPSRPDRNVDAEAWIFIGGSLLVSIADRLGGPLRAEGFAVIKAERQRCLTGSA